MDPKLGRTLAFAVACGCFALYGTGIAQSQQEKQQQKQEKPSGDASRGATQQTQKKEPPVAGRIKLGTTVVQTEAIAKGHRISKLVGAEVKNDVGERIGRIEDMIVSPDGKVTMAILEVGGFLGIGDRRVAIPVEQFSTLTPGTAILPGANKTAVRNLPEFQYAST
jgi:sporulation protein YlmC with PRC-barrel domain